MSYEAIAHVRRRGSTQPAHPSMLKWLTVTKRDTASARQAFEDLGFEVLGAVQVLDQGVASALAEKL